MDAVVFRGLLLVTAFSSIGATYRTPNFVVDAPTPEIAEQVGQVAEHYRKTLAVEWLGKEMPNWHRPCTVKVKVGQIGAGGATSFSFDRGEVFGWRMNVQGSLERILDSVVPHEVSHTVLACRFRRPLPRWADEGAATLAEHDSEKLRQKKLVEQILNTTRRIPFRELFAIKEYPRDMNDVLTLYAEGYSLAEYLVQQGGRNRFLQFLDDAHQQGWDRAIAKHYREKDVNDLERQWNSWVVAGSPRLNLPEGQLLAAAEDGNNGTGSSQPIVRAQSPESEAAPPVRLTQPPRVALGTSSENHVVGSSFATTPETKPQAQTEVTNPPSVTSEETIGQIRALNEGWSPVSRKGRSPDSSRTNERSDFPQSSVRVRSGSADPASRASLSP